MSITIARALLSASLLSAPVEPQAQPKLESDPSWPTSAPSKRIVNHKTWGPVWPTSAPTERIGAEVSAAGNALQLAEAREPVAPVVTPSPPVEPEAREPSAPPLTLSIAPAFGVTSRRLPVTADPMVRARARAAVALGGTLRVSSLLEPRPVWLYGQLLYLSSVGMRLEETRTDGSRPVTRGRTQRVALGVGVLAARRVDSVIRVGAELGYALRPFTAEAALASPAESMIHGPYLGVPARARVPGLALPLELALIPEVAVHARLGGYPNDQVRSYGLGVGGTLTVELRVHRWISIGLAYREAYSLFDAVDPIFVTDRERFVTVRLRVGRDPSPRPRSL